MPIAQFNASNVGKLALDFTLVARSGNLGLGTYTGWASNGSAVGDSITPDTLKGEDIFTLATLGGASPRAGNLQLEVRNVQVVNFIFSVEIELGPLAGIEFRSADADFVPGARSSWYWAAAAMTAVTTPVAIKV